MVIAGLHLILLLVAVTETRQSHPGLRPISSLKALQDLGECFGLSDSTTCYTYNPVGHGYVHGLCPKLDCVMKKREMCSADSQKCGPCLPHFEDSKYGKCELKGSRRLKHMGPESLIDIIQYRMSKEHKVNPTASTTVAVATTTIAVSSPYFTSTGDKPKLLHSNSDVHVASLLISTLPPQMKDRKLGRRRKSEMNQTMSLTLIVICSLTAFSGVLVVAMCWYRLQKEVRLAQEMAYTAYKGSRQHPCHRSADQMSHYMQHYSAQKKHFQAQESSSEKKPCQQLSTDSEAEGEEFAIYECPGLAPTGEMEIHNPLFDPSRTKQ